jgi:flagellin
MGTIGSIGSPTNYANSAVNNAKKSLTKIATGLAVNQAADNSAGMMLSSMMQSEKSGFASAMKNVNSGSAMMQIADGALSEYSDILNTIKSKTIQAANDTNSPASREALQGDIDALLSQAESIATSTNYNGKALLDGSQPPLNIQAGNGAGEVIETPTVDLTTANLGIGNIDVSSSALANGSLVQIDQALEQLNSYRSDIGASQSALSSTLNNLSTSRVNEAASQSAIADLDFAQESANFTKENLLTQISAYTASQQNNVLHNNVMQLLR